jgi:hypothetical protein
VQHTYARAPAALTYPTGAGVLSSEDMSVLSSEDMSVL